MTSAEREALVMQLLAIRSQCDAALAVYGVSPETGSDIEPQACSHPLDKRTNLTTMGGPEHWQCQVCGYEYTAVRGDLFSEDFSDDFGTPAEPHVEVEV